MQEGEEFRLCPTNLTNFNKSHGRDSSKTLLQTSTLSLLSLLNIDDPFKKQINRFRKAIKSKKAFTFRERERQGCVLKFIVILSKRCESDPNSVSFLSESAFSSSSLNRSELSASPRFCSSFVHFQFHCF